MPVGLCLPEAIQHGSSCGGWRNSRCGAESFRECLQVFTQTTIKINTYVFSASSLQDLNPRFHYIDWLQPFIPALCANQSLALAASLPNIETLQLSHGAGHWGTSICRWSWMGIPKLLPGLQYEAVGRKANPAGSWVGSVSWEHTYPKG